MQLGMTIDPGPSLNPWTGSVFTDLDPKISDLLDWVGTGGPSSDCGSGSEYDLGSEFADPF